MFSFKELTDKYYNFLSLKTSKSKNRLKNSRSFWERKVVQRYVEYFEPPNFSRTFFKHILKNR